jgi:hypothetical protein
MRPCEAECIEVWESGEDALITRVSWSDADEGIVVESMSDSYTSIVFWTVEEGQRLIDALTESLRWMQEHSE